MTLIKITYVTHNVRENHFSFGYKVHFSEIIMCLSSKLLKQNY